MPQIFKFIKRYTKYFYELLLNQKFLTFPIWEKINNQTLNGEEKLLRIMRENSKKIH